MHLKSIVFALLSISMCAFSQDTIQVTEYGLKPNSRINAVRAVKNALEACRAKENPVLVFPKGRYDFWPEYSTRKLYYESNTDVIPERVCPILIENFKGLTIDCEGSDFIFHAAMQPFTIDKSENITLKNINIDWDIPLTAQAQVVETNDNYIDIAINVLESPYVIENSKIYFVGEGWKSKMWEWSLIEFEKDTKLIPQGSGDGSLGSGFNNYKAEELKYGLIRLNHKFTRKPAVGNYIILRHSARDHAGTFVVDSKNIRIENMNMYHNCGLGILSQYSENLSYYKVNFIPNSAKNRYLSGHDDGFQFSNCKGQLLVDQCAFQGLMDDPINIHGTSVRVQEIIDNNTLICKFMERQSKGFTWARTNENIAFINKNALNTYGAGMVSEFNPITVETFKISFKNPVPNEIQVGDALENLSWTPDATIKDSHFGSNRARGILVTTPGKVIIENNTFESSGSAILISGDANGWYESGAVNDVLIRNNIFNDPCNTSSYQFCEAIISIFPIIPNPDTENPFHRNIRIEGNEFHPFDFPVLYALSVDGLTFNKNLLIRSTKYKATHERKATITLEACKNVQVKDNLLRGDILGRNIKLVNTKKSDVKISKKQGLNIEM